MRVDRLRAFQPSGDSVTSTAGPRLSELLARLRVLARAHRPFTGVLLVGVVVRIACAVAYWPGLFYPDSWRYLQLAYRGSPVAFAPERPSGYPLLIRLLTLPLRHVAIVTSIQHLAGLVIGTFVYAVLLRLGVRRWLAVAAAAFALLDGDLIVLEQFVMPETFVGLLLVASAYFALSRPATVRHLAISGALLGAAVPLREAAVFVVPVWLLFVARTGPSMRALATSVVAVLAAPLSYGILQEASGYGSPLETSAGWFPYGRVAGFANCSDPSIPTAARPLCPTGSERGWSGPRYIWGPSPATRRFPAGPGGRDTHANSLLIDFALGVIRDQPFTYAWTVGKDTLRLFATSGGDRASDLLAIPTARTVAASNASHIALQRALFPQSPPSGIRFPASAFRYYRIVSPPGWLTALLLLAAIAALIEGAVGRGRSGRARRPWQIFLLSGSAFAVTTATVATVGPDYRYLLVVLPLLAAGGALAVDDGLELRSEGAWAGTPA